MLDNISVGKRIAYLRKQKGLTQEELAERLEITAQAISKWEKGHTLPETALLPLLSHLFDCTIDSILMPKAMQEAAFREFADNIGGDRGVLAFRLYQNIKNKFDFTIDYYDEFNVWDTVYSGRSAAFIRPERDGFVMRVDIYQKSSEKIVCVRLPLPNCTKYTTVIDEMPEYVKKCFRVSDCNCCIPGCSVLMDYVFEGISYRQCHFITLPLHSIENMEHILTLFLAEQRI